MTGLRRTAIAAALAVLLAWWAPLSAQPGQAADSGGYGTAARAEYVFACMATNGGTQEALQRCSCAIDVIAPPAL